MENSVIVGDFLSLRHSDAQFWWFPCCYQQLLFTVIYKFEAIDLTMKCIWNNVYEMAAILSGGGGGVSIAGGIWQHWVDQLVVILNGKSKHVCNDYFQLYCWRTCKYHTKWALDIFINSNCHYTIHKQGSIVWLEVKMRTAACNHSLVL